MSNTTPEQIRSLLGDLLQVIDKTARVYRAIVVHAPGSSVRHSQLEGWLELCDLATRTASQARELLEGVEAEFADDAPPPYMAQSLAKRLTARRATMSATGVSRPRLH